MRSEHSRASRAMWNVSEGNVLVVEATCLTKMKRTRPHWPEEEGHRIANVDVVHGFQERLVD